MVRTLKREFTYADDLSSAIMTPPSELLGDGDTNMPDASFTSANGLPRMFQAADLVDRNDDVSRNIRSTAPSVDSGLHFLGRRVQVLVDAINDFRKFGVDHVVELPELVLVGDQSAGKSSLMGALAEIHLPRSAGCCTRCPAHIKTGPADVWSCKVSLHQHYKYEPTSGKPLESRDVTKNRPFPPWKEQDLVVKHFTTIDDKRELENVLKWAQIATLNPNKPHTLYIPNDNAPAPADEETEAKFSPNVVSVEISGPGLPSLSFYDLPGIFQNTSHKEDTYLVKVIENLAIKYIKHPQALIICALPMSADPATSRTGKVIADLNAENRTIGVLTKADRLPEGQSLDDFQNILEGRDHVVGHGYFVTKLPGGSILNSYDENYHHKARIAEDDFFYSQAPWAEWSDFRHRYGTRNLQQALSQKFAQQIVNSMPTIERKIRYRAQEIENELSRLPELPTNNVLHVVLQHLARFSTQVQAFLGGESSHDFLSDWQRLCWQFKEIIHEMRPKITITHPSDAQSFAPREVIAIDDSDGDEEPDSATLSVGSSRKREREEAPMTSTPDKRSRMSESSFQTPVAPASATTKRDGIPLRAATPATPTPMSGKIQNQPAVIETPSPFASFASLGSHFASLNEVREKIARYRRIGVPGHVNVRVQDGMCMDAVSSWEQPMELLLDKTLESLREKTDEVLGQVLGNWQQTQLFKESKTHLKSFFDEFEGEQRRALSEIFKLEAYKLFTMNQEVFDRNKAQQLKVLQEARRKRRVKLYCDRHYPNQRPEARAQQAKKVTDENLGPDPFKIEIDVAAFVRGYYVTSAQRFIDNICMTIHGQLFRRSQLKIFYYLESKLGLDQGHGEERCKELMEENASVAAKRQALKTEKQNLEKFTARLLQLAADNEALDAENM